MITRKEKYKQEREMMKMEGKLIEALLSELDRYFKDHDTMEDLNDFYKKDILIKVV